MTIKAVSVASAALLIMVAVLGTGWISYDVEAADFDDPFDVKAAPHFSDVAYTLSKPTFQTAFDSIGKFKVSVGSPLVSLSNSTLGIAAPTATEVELTISETDAPGINTTVRSYIQTKVRADNVAAQYTNITLENTHTHDVALIALHSTTKYSFSGPAGQVTGNLYASTQPDTWYRAAFELTTTGVTFYLYSLDGTLLGNHYTNTANLTVAHLDEIHFSVDANAGSASFDYLYVTSQSPTANPIRPTTTKQLLTPDKGKIVDVCDVDPTDLKMDRSGGAAAKQVFDLPTREFVPGEDLNASEFLEIFGNTPELNQRLTGKYVAKGWSDFRADLEIALKAKIAENHGVSFKDVYLVDYYIDYLQLATDYDTALMTKMEQNFWQGMAEGFEAAGATVEYQTVEEDWWEGIGFVQGQTIAVDPAEYRADFDWGNPNVEIVKFFVNSDAQFKEGMNRGLFNVLFGTDRYYEDMKKQLEGVYADSNARLDAMWNYTVESFGQVRKDYQAFATWVTGSVDNVTKGYEDAIDSIEKMNAQFFDWSTQQFAASNAMFSQLFNKSDEAQRWFAGQIAKQNEVIANITSDMFGSTNATIGMWNDFLLGGKPLIDTPLTLAGFFGSEFFTYLVVIIVCIVLAALIIMIARRPKNRGGRRAR